MKRFLCSVSALVLLSSVAQAQYAPGIVPPPSAVAGHPVIFKDRFHVQDGGAVSGDCSGFPALVCQTLNGVSPGPFYSTSGPVAPSAKIDTTNSNNVNYLAPFANAVSRTVQQKASDTIDVRDFTGPFFSGDITNALNSALTALSSTGGTLNYCGVYQGSGGHVIPNEVIINACAGAIYNQNTATGNTFTIGTGTTCATANGCPTNDSGIIGLTIQPLTGVTRTSGDAILSKFTNRPKIKNNIISGQFVGIELYGNQYAQVEFNNILQSVNSTQCSPVDTCGSRSLWLHGITTSNEAIDYIAFNDIFNIPSGSYKGPDYTTYLGGNTQGEVFFGNNVYGGYKTLWITTLTGNSDAAGPVIQSFFNMDEWDSPTQITSGTCTAPEVNDHVASIHADGGNSSFIANLSFVGEWFATSSCGNGLDINGTVSPITLIRLSSPQSLNNWGSGISIQNASEIYIDNPESYGNGRVSSNTLPGIAVAASASHVTIKNGMSRPGPIGGGLVNTQNYGVTVANGATFVTINGVDVSNNLTGGIQNLAATGSNNRFEANLGYNPVGVTNPSLGASPYTYTANSSPENEYLTGGAFSVSTSGGLVCSGPPCNVMLGPNESMVVTYTTAPVWIKAVH